MYKISLLRIHNNSRAFRQIIRNKNKKINKITNKNEINKPFICEPYKLNKTNKSFINVVSLVIRKFVQ
jgi:hypothetical protein